MTVLRAAPATPTTVSAAELVTAIVILLLGVAVIAAVIAVVASPRARRVVPRVTGTSLVALSGLFLVARGAAELWVIDYSDPSSYADAWGGPSLVGVFAVHSGPGLVVIVGALLWWRHRRRAARSREARAAAPGEAARPQPATSPSSPPDRHTAGGRVPS